MVMVLISFFCLSSSLPLVAPLFALEKHHYYLQVGSFRVQNNALRLKEEIQTKGLQVIIKEKRLSTKDLLHQVFVGPFDSRKKAEDAKLTLRKSGIFLEDVFVVHESAVFPQAEFGPGIQPEAGEEATAPATPPSAAETGPAPSSYEAETAPAVEKKSVVPQTETEIEKVDQKSVRRGDGRNLAKKSISVAYRHSYVEYPTELISRTAISTSGGTTTSRPLSPAAFADADLDTVMHIDTIRLRFGITDFLEIYGDLGTAYRNFATPQFVYGVGARINVLSIELGGHRSFYGALQGDFLAGKLEEE